ncbi:MAG TPA: LPS assembly lipoprotein LptE, partial [Planctomycetota bacterium]|nr:LPS assembly lipoprotein LptE [Planctomycetota bacterium]
MNGRAGKRAHFLLPLLLASCGYTAGVKMPGDVRSVAVPVFGNETFRRGLEYDLTAAVARAFLDRTDLRVCPVSEAEAIVRGRIRRATTPVLVERGPDALLESAALLTVEAELVGARSGRVLARMTVTDRAEIAAARGETRAGAFQESIETIAERIVLGLAERGRVGEPAGSLGEPPA